MPSTGASSQIATGPGTRPTGSSIVPERVAQGEALRLSGSLPASNSPKSNRELQPTRRQFLPRSCAGRSPAAFPLADYFDALFSAHGPQHWWPGRSRFEIIVGAILTQSTSWTNVERAIANLRRAKLLSPKAILKVSSPKLARLLRPSGYFRQKTKTLKTFVDFLFHDYKGSLDRLFATPTRTLREQLLALCGIGPETADSILLYAGHHPVFVVDAYTRRILERHDLAYADASYEQIRSLFESALPRDHQLFNEFHALIVHTGKHHCRRQNPVCSECPLKAFLPKINLVQFEPPLPSPSHDGRGADHGTRITPP